MSNYLFFYKETQVRLVNIYIISIFNQKKRNETTNNKLKNITHQVNKQKIKKMGRSGQLIFSTVENLHKKLKPKKVKKINSKMIPILLKNSIQ